jgi:hypothetical protein
MSDVFATGFDIQKRSVIFESQPAPSISYKVIGAAQVTT